MLRERFCSCGVHPPTAMFYASDWDSVGVGPKDSSFRRFDMLSQLIVGGAIGRHCARGPCFGSRRRACGTARAVLHPGCRRQRRHEAHPRAMGERPRPRPRLPSGVATTGAAATGPAGNWNNGRAIATTVATVGTTVATVATTVATARRGMAMAGVALASPLASASEFRWVTTAAATTTTTTIHTTVTLTTRPRLSAARLPWRRLDACRMVLQPLSFVPGLGQHVPALPRAASAVLFAL